MWKVIKSSWLRCWAKVVWYMALALVTVLGLSSGDLRSHVSDVDWNRPPSHLKPMLTGWDDQIFIESTLLEVSFDSKGLISEITFKMVSE